MLMKLLKYSPYIILIAFLLIIVINFKFYRIEGFSMEPTISNGQFVIAKNQSKNFDVGNVIVYEYENDIYIKRIIAKGGYSFSLIGGKLKINGIEFIQECFDSCIDQSNQKIPEGEYFVIGDNPRASIDSRMIGTISEDSIVGYIPYK